MSYDDVDMRRPCSPPAAETAAAARFKADVMEWRAQRAAGAGIQGKVVEASGGFKFRNFAGRPDIGISVSGLAARLCDDVWMSRPSILLLLVFWPFATICMVIAQIQRIYTVGSVRRNVGHIVSHDARIMNPILALSGCELGRRIKLPPDDPEKLTSVQLVELCITQIRLTNLYLLAVVATRFDSARREAIEADLAVANGTAPDEAFWGVPILVKECFELPGMPYTGGIIGRRSRIGVKTATAIGQLQHAGAVILGSTNVSEACMWHESTNHVYGTTNNPYDFGRTAGGSSGGIGAAVSACMVPIGVSSDVGGSTRIPALYNGLFGHKPTGGAISNENTFPSCGTGAIQRYCQLGPTCRHSEDLWPLLCTLLNHNKSELHDDLCPVLLNSPNDLEMSSVIVYDLCSNLGNDLLLSTIHPDQRAAQRTAVEQLKRAGASVRFLNIPSMTEGLNAFSVWSAMMDRESPHMFDTIIREGLGAMFHPWELMKSFVGMSAHTTPAMLLAISQKVVSLAPNHAQNLCMLGEKMKAELYSALKSSDDNGVTIYRVIVMPSLACMAPMHMESLFRIFDTSNTSFFNAMEVPVTAVPMGLSAISGLPTGIQIVADHGHDFVSIAIARKLENLGAAGWKPPVSDEIQNYF